MTDVKVAPMIHPGERELADFLDDLLPAKERKRLEDHMAACDECLAKVVSAYESVELFNKKSPARRRKGDTKMRKMNLYAVLAILSFSLSFILPRYFLQLLAATILLGIKWIVDAKSTKMLIMIYEAWKKGGDKEVRGILETMDSADKTRF